MKWVCTVAFAFVCLLSLGSQANGQLSPSRPNIVVILADDLGYSDIGCYGGEIRTPNLDKLAKDGLRFVQFYNTPRCCASRAALLTGLYPHQAGVGNMTADQKLPGYRGSLNERCLTLAQALRLAGYRTFMVGKWHLGQPGPLARGFQEYFGLLGGFDSFWNPAPYVRLPKDRAMRMYAEDRFFATDAFTDYALDFLAQARKKPQEPWFLYVAHTAPHFPLHAHEEDIAKYKQMYQKGWDQIRSERWQKQRAIKLIDPSWPLSPRSDYLHKFSKEQRANPAWNTLDADRKKDLARRMAVYAAMVERMDRNIGRLIDDLDKHKQLENTLLVFLSDNGGSAEWDHLGFDFASGPKNVLHKGDDLQKIGAPGSYVSAGSGWGNAQNTPFRWYKHHCYEGGVSTPFIVHWPVGIQARGELRQQVGHLIDLMPTCLEAASAEYPREFEGKKVQALEGKSLVPAFANRPIQRGPLFWEHEGHRAVRDGKWKLVANKGLPWELYDLEADRVELKNLAKALPERVEAMGKQWHAWAVRAQVFPSPFLGMADGKPTPPKKKAKGGD
jgi:arylsulfatase A-like enzyme